LPDNYQLEQIDGKQNDDGGDEVNSDVEEINAGDEDAANDDTANAGDEADS
jgi:hypothetical protein